MEEYPDPSFRTSRRDFLQMTGGAFLALEAALQQGATREEIAEALGVAITVNAGAALVYSVRALDAVAQGSAAASVGR